MPLVDTLVRHELLPDGRLVVRTPRTCPEGHRLTGGRVLVGYEPCACPAEGLGHQVWTCRHGDAHGGRGCGAQVLDPPCEDPSRRVTGAYPQRGF